MEQLIRQWAIDKELDKGHPYSQYIKMMEEQGELAEALVKKQSLVDVKDAIGDVYVTLVILAQQLETSVAECSQIAYSVIKDRQGKTVDGTFIKDADLGGRYYYDTDGQGD